MKTNQIHITNYEKLRDNYPLLSRGADVLDPPPAKIIGRDINELKRGLRNPEKANVVLLAEPGSGKTAFVQAFAYDPESLKYYLVLDVNPERLIDKDGDRDNALLTGFTGLLDEAGRYSKDQDVIVVLFVDEFHKLAEISPNLLETIKPKLEKSAMHGFRLIAATTFEEYNKNIAKNRALDQRFVQIKLAELPKEAVLTVLRNRAKEHGVEQLLDEGVLDDIYTESKRVLMSNAQPRASIDVFNSMIGDSVKAEHMEKGKLVKTFYTGDELGYPTDRILSRPCLKRVIKRMHGIDIDNEVDATQVIDALRNRLFNQDQAINVIVRQLEMAAQGFGEMDRPKFSFISTGSTGVGKALRDDEPIPAPVPEGYLRNGDLKPGDYVYNKYGKRTRVTGVFHKGPRTVFQMTLADGRRIDSARDHLWTYRDGDGPWETGTTEKLLQKLVDGHVLLLPSGGAVERDGRDYVIDPYGFGLMLGSIDSGLRFNHYIPDGYKSGSVEQRRALVQGLFDMRGNISDDGDLLFRSASRRLTRDVREILWSLGVSSAAARDGEAHGNTLKIRVPNGRKADFFRDPGKVSKAEAVRDVPDTERFDAVGIRHIEKLDEKVPMTCIMVDDPEHLYLAGKGHIVTHNTEMAKIISETMHIPLKRFDMSRYSSPEDAGAFADNLFQAAWSTPNAYLLIDEVEKSSKKAMNILLQVLDDARLTDSVNPDRVASFAGTIINLTTNLGSEVYRDMARHKGDNAEADIEVVYKSLADSDVFETAVLGRLDAIVPFRPLPAEALMKIATRTLGDAVELKETKERRIIVSDDVIPYIVKDRTSYDTERGGARDVKRNVKSLVVQELAHYLTYAKKEVPILIYIKGKPRFKYKEVADPLNAKVAIRECYPVSVVDTLLAGLSGKLGKPLTNLGLYLPVNKELKAYVEEIAQLSVQGYHKFRSVIDGENVRIQGVSI